MKTSGSTMGRTRSPPSSTPLSASVCRTCAAKPPIATAYAKEAAKSGFELDLKSGLQLEKSLFTLLLGTEDKKEAAAAFKEKRKPVFSGK